MKLEDMKKLLSSKDQTDLIYEMSRLVSENNFLKETIENKDKEIERLSKLLG